MGQSTGSGFLCFDPEIQIGVRGIPCATANPDFPVIGISPCDDYVEQVDGITTFTALDQNGLIPDFQLGTFWYFSVRKINTDYLSTCNFQFFVNISTCPPNQVALGVDTVCFPTTTINTGSWVNIAATTADTLIYVVNFATDQALVNIIVNSTTIATASASWGFALAFADSDRCWGSSDLNNQIIVSCVAVPAGNFYIALESVFAIGASSIIVSPSQCPTGFSGLNCANPLVAFNPSQTYSGTIPPFNSSYLFTPQTVFYYDFVVNSSLYLNITMNNSTGLGNLVMRKGSFPYMDIIASGTGGEGVFFAEVEPFPAGILFNFGDSYVGGRYYWSIANTDPSKPMTYQMTTINGGTSTTGGAATGASTTSKSDARALVIPVFLLACLIAALL